MRPNELAGSVAQVNALGAALFAWLPVRGSFSWRSPAWPDALLVTTSQRVWRAAGASKRVVFEGRELHALTVAAENDRGGVRELAAWCGRKVAQPWWRLTPKEALGGLVDVLPEQRWTIGRVLAAYGGAVVSVGFADEVPA